MHTTNCTHTTRGTNCTHTTLGVQEGYFDKGFSNYNSVAAFFNSVLEVDMLANVLYERKSLLYEELIELVISQRMLVTCCIDAHFTAFQARPGTACR